MRKLLDDRRRTLTFVLYALGVAVWPAVVGFETTVDDGFDSLEITSPLVDSDSSTLDGQHPTNGNRTREIEKQGAQSSRPNIILISIDTLRADHLSLYGYDHPTSPSIDAWGRRFAVVFQNTVAQAPWTLPSHGSMLTGFDALHHGVNHSFEAAPPELTTIAEVLSQEGYTTAGLTGGGWLHPRYGLVDGYDRYRFGSNERRGDEELEAHTAIASRWLDELPQPFFLFLHTYDVHDFNAPQRMTPPGFEDPVAHLVRHYDRAVTHMDDFIGRFLERFAASGLRGRTILALTSDHGEDLGEDGVFGHGSLRDQVLMVPLVLELPSGLGAGQTIEDQVRSVDIVPTLLELAGIESPQELDGVSLRALISGDSSTVPPVATSYFTLQHGLSLRFRNRWKYLYDSSAWQQNKNRETLFQLPGGESRQRHDRAPGHPQTGRFRALAQQLLEERLRGLRLRFDNASRDPWVGTLRGDLIHLGVPKSIDLTGPWLQREGDDAARFEIPPGRRFHLLFERVGEAGFELEAGSAAGTDPGHRLVIDLKEMTLPATFVWTGTGWEKKAGTASLEAKITLEWQGRGAPEGVPPFEQDPELRRQLEALGYL